MIKPFIQPATEWHSIIAQLTEGNTICIFNFENTIRDKYLNNVNVET